ncbi:MAG: hypothetical protein ABI833_20540 [Acidobacteriota bacterium]
MSPRLHDAEVSIPLDAGWEMASTPDPLLPETLSGLRFIPAKVPSTVASALRDQGAWHMGDGTRFDASEYWFRCRFDAEPTEAGEEIALRIGGIATVAEVWLNGEKILKSSSMFASNEVNVSALVRDRNEVLIVCRSLTAAMREQRRRPPAARWRTRVVAEQQLRWFRTTFLGRAPGFAREPEPVGPWRPITMVRRRRVVIENWSRQADLDGTAGVIRFDVQMRSLQADAKPVAGRILSGDAEALLDLEQLGAKHHGRAVLRIPNAQRWWPHTHGEPALYALQLELQLADGSIVTFDDLPVGFRPEAIASAGG